MDRSWSLTEDGATDGGIDIREKSTGNQALLTSSSGHLVYKLTSSLHTGLFDWKTSPSINSFFHEETGNVKVSSSVRRLAGSAAEFQNFRQSDFNWKFGEIGRGRLLTDASSLMRRTTDDHSYASTTETFLAPTAHRRQLEPPSSAIHNQQVLSSSAGTLKHTSTGSEINSVIDGSDYSAVDGCTESPVCTSDVANLEPSHWLLVESVFDKLQVLNSKSTAFDLSRISTNVDTDPDFGFLTVNTELLVTPGEVGAKREASTETTRIINKSLEPTVNISLPTIALTDTSSHVLREHSVVPIDVRVLTEDSQLLPVAVTPTELTPDKFLNEVTWVPSVGFVDAINFITSGITPGDTVAPFTSTLHQSDVVAYSADSSSVGHRILGVASPSILEDNDSWLYKSQLTNIRNTTDAFPSLTSKHFLTTDSGSVSAGTTLIAWPHRTPLLNIEDTVLFPFSALTFPDSHIVDYSSTYSDLFLTTTSEEEIQNQFKTKAGANNTNISSTLQAHSSPPSIVKPLQPISEAVNILPSHSIVNYKPSRDHFSILTMEISTSSSIYLQPSTTLSYDSTLSAGSSPGNDNWNIAEVFNDLHAETVSHQPLSLQSPTINQDVTQDIASNPTLVQAIDPAPTVSVSSTMFITWEKSGHTSSTLPNVTDVVHATGLVTTTQKMHTADGETTSRQTPNFNTTIIIASACAVLALVIFVIITICCLRRRRRSKSSSSRQEGDDLWVDLYRSNSSHQMPLPSLTTCPSTFEMTDTLKSDSTEDIPDNKHKDRYTPEAGSSVMNQMKSQRKISSFQIKNPKLEAEGELEPRPPASEQGYSEDQAENWVKMTTSLSMTSLPTTEVSYHTNITDYNLAAVGQKFRAVYNYKPVCKGEMALKEGELVECKERDRNGWMLGYKPRTNEEGWFPAVYVDELSSDDDLDFTCEMPETYDILESNKLNSTDQYWTGIEHRVCYSYHSSVPGDLDIEVGQIVIVLQTLANGWWFAVNGNKCGWFPGSYVEMIIDSSREEQPSNGTSCELDDDTSVSTETQDATAVRTAEDKSDTTIASLARISELPEEKESADEDQIKCAKTDVANETSNLNVSTSAAIQIGNKNEFNESSCTVDTSEIKLTSLSTLNEQTPEKADTHSTGSLSIKSATAVCIDKSPLTQKRLENSLRPVRPAPPPPKPNGSKVKKDSKISAENNSIIQASKAQDPVLKKPVILIHGKRPKMQKVLRSQLDEKQLSPMIRPSTRGFIPKPTAYTHNGLRNEYSSTAEHAHSSQSIINDLHSEQITLSQAHNSASHTSLFQPLNFRPLAQQEYKSSKSSLESCPESRLAYPRGSTPHGEPGKVNHSNISNYFSHERSLTPDYRRERSLTPDYKRDRSNSPILLTSGNLLQNVQRFHGALKHPIPLNNEKGSLKDTSAEKRETEFTLVNTPPNTLSTFSRHQRPAPTTAPNLKIPSQKSLHNKQTFGSPHDQNSVNNSMNVPYDYQSSNKHANSEKMLPTNMLPIYADGISENTSNIKHPSVLPKSDTIVHQEPFIVIPGTVSEIVQQINKQSPLQTELLQKLRSDRRQHEPADFPNRDNLLGETNAHKLVPTEPSQNTSNNGFRDVSFKSEPTTAL